MLGRLVLLLIVLLSASPLRAGWLEAQFAPRADLWECSTPHDPASTLRVDHTPWSRFLATYRELGDDGVARVAYGRVGAADRVALDDYVAALAALPARSLNRAEQLVYWINLYNALTVRLVLAHYPVASIRDIDISPGLFAIGPWDKKLLAVEGQEVSLNDIEHRILRPVWRDPRLHYAVNCAAIGCPNLLAEPFTTATTEALLEAAARAYVNHPRGVTVGDGGATVSSIYSWFREDFGGSEAGVLAHLRRYAAPPLAARLASVREIARDRYDWSLNDAQ